MCRRCGGPALLLPADVGRLISLPAAGGKLLWHEQPGALQYLHASMSRKGSTRRCLISAGSAACTGCQTGSKDELLPSRRRAATRPAPLWPQDALLSDRKRPLLATQVHRNLDPSLHPFEKAKEYTRALNAGAALMLSQLPTCAAWAVGTAAGTKCNAWPVGQSCPDCHVRTATDGARCNVAKLLPCSAVQPSWTACLPSPSWPPSRTTTASRAWPATRAASTRCCRVRFMQHAAGAAGPFGELLLAGMRDGTRRCNRCC